jgi:hypothetical protein
MESVSSFKISHFGRQSQLAKPSSLTLTMPDRTMEELLAASVLRVGEPPMPE